MVLAAEQDCLVPTMSNLSKTALETLNIHLQTADIHIITYCDIVLFLYFSYLHYMGGHCFTGNQDCSINMSPV